MSRLANNNDCTKRFEKTKNAADIETDLNRSKFKSVYTAAQNIYKHEYHIKKRLNRKETLAHLLEIIRINESNKVLIICKDRKDKDYFRNNRRLRNTKARVILESQMLSEITENTIVFLPGTDSEGFLKRNEELFKTKREALILNRKPLFSFENLKRPDEEQVSFLTGEYSYLRKVRNSNYSKDLLNLLYIRRKILEAKLFDRLDMENFLKAIETGSDVSLGEVIQRQDKSLFFEPDGKEPTPFTEKLKDYCTIYENLDEYEQTIDPEISELYLFLTVMLEDLEIIEKSVDKGELKIILESTRSFNKNSLRNIPRVLPEMRLLGEDPFSSIDERNLRELILNHPKSAELLRAESPENFNFIFSGIYTDVLLSEGSHVEYLNQESLKDFRKKLYKYINQN